VGNALVVERTERRMLGNAGWLSVLQMFNYISPLLVLPLLTRALGVEEFGVVMVAMAAIQLSFVLSDYGFSLSATYFIARNSSEVDEIGRLIGRVFAAKLILLVIAIPLLLVLSRFFNYDNSFWLFAAGIGAVASQAFQSPWFFHGLAKMKAYVVYMSLTKVLYVILVLLLVDSDGDGALVPLSWSIANAIGMILALYLMTSLGYQPRLGTIKDALGELKSSAAYFWSRLAVAIYTSASALIVGLESVSQAAYFSSAELIYKAGQNVTSPINQALFPYMSKEKNWKMFFFITPAVLIILIAGCTLVGYFSVEIVNIIFGENYNDVIPVLQVLLYVVVINYLTVTFGYPVFSALGRPQIANYTVIIGSIFHVIVLSGLVISANIDAHNVAFTVAATETLVLVLRVATFIVFRSNDIRS
jgi:PST family polysaccharide transporter